MRFSIYFTSFFLIIFSSCYSMNTEFSESKSLTSPNRLTARDCICAFEQGEYQKAFSGFLKLKKLGGTIGEAYLNYINSHKLTNITEEDRETESLPARFFDQSKDYLSASLIIMKFYGREGLKKESLKKTVRQLDSLVRSKSSRAIVFLIQMIENQQYRNEVLRFLKTPLKDANKFCSNLLSKKFNTYLSSDQAGVLSDQGSCEICLYRSTLTFNPDALFDIDILSMCNRYCIIPSKFSKIFSLFFLCTQKNSEIAAYSIFKYTQEPIWLRFALENGEKEAVVDFPLVKSHHNEEARYFHYRAAEHESVESEYHYASMLRQGIGGAINLEGARFYLERAANKEHQQSVFKYALMLKNGEGGEKDLVTARKLFLLLAEKDNSESQYHLGCMFKNGEGGPQDLSQARVYLELSAKAGNTEAESEYAFLLQDKDAEFINLEEARKFHYSASKKGHEKSYQEYAKMIRMGEGGLPDPVEAREYYRLLANKGIRFFQHEYARMLYNGEGGEVDFQTAREYFRILADQGDGCAAHQYAQMLREGKGGQVNLFEAQRYFLLGAEQGNACCQFYYAQMLRRGEGVKKNFTKAREYFLKASNQGYADAAINLQELNLQIEKENNIVVIKKFIKLVENNEEHCNIEDTVITYTFPYIAIDENEGCSSSDSDEDQPSPNVEEESEKNKAPVIVEKEICSERSLLWIEQARSRREEKRKGKMQKCIKCIDHSFKKIVIEDENEDLETHSSQHHCDSGKKVWYVKDKNTINFVDAIFSRNGQKISSFTVHDACKAFTDLGCTAGKSRVGDNKIAVIYTDNIKKIIHKYKFHTPHGHGDKNLYIAIVPYTKRFLISIGLEENSPIEFKQ